MLKTEKISIPLTTASWLLSFQAQQRWQHVKSRPTAGVPWEQTEHFPPLGLPDFARQLSPHLKKGVSRTSPPLPAPPHPNALYSSQLLFIEIKLNFLLICFIMAVLIDLATIKTTARIKPKCRNKTWGRGTMKTS